MFGEGTPGPSTCYSVCMTTGKRPLRAQRSVPHLYEPWIIRENRVQAVGPRSSADNYCEARRKQNMYMGVVLVSVTFTSTQGVFGCNGARCRYNQPVISTPCGQMHDGDGSPCAAPPTRDGCSFQTTGARCCKPYFFTERTCTHRFLLARENRLRVPCLA